MPPLVPSLDLRPANPSDPARAPSNIEAEQALLGCLLYDNNAFHRFEGLTADHFYEPFHGFMYELIDGMISKGMTAEPILLAEPLMQSPAFQEMGGISYLAELVDRAPPAANAAGYANTIIDRAQRRNLISACGEAMKAVTEDLEHTGVQHIETLEQDLFAMAETKASRGFRAFSTFVTGAIEMAAAAYGRDGGLAGLSTGLESLDDKLGGLHPSDLLILAGRPSMGKTALACNIAFNAARAYAYETLPDGLRRTINGARVGFFSLEMSGSQLAMRLLAEASGVSGERLRRGQVEAHEFNAVRDAAELISTIPLYIDDSPALSVAQVATRARRLKRTTGLDLVVVDYLQLLRGAKRYSGGERVQEVSEITVGLKAIAKELDVPVLALSQLSRAVEQREDKKPQLSDLRESGSIEQDADVVMFCYREEYYLARTEPDAGSEKHLDWVDKMDQVRGKAEVIIGKQRHGPIGTARMGFNGDITKFFDLPRPAPTYVPGRPRDPTGGQ